MNDGGRQPPRVVFKGADARNSRTNATLIQRNNQRNTNSIKKHLNQRTLSFPVKDTLVGIDQKAKHQISRNTLFLYYQTYWPDKC